VCRREKGDGESQERSPLEAVSDKKIWSDESDESADEADRLCRRRIDALLAFPPVRAAVCYLLSADWEAEKKVRKSPKA
jgi:hypothetical protein